MSPEIKLTPQRSKAQGKIELVREQSRGKTTLPTFNRTGKIVTVNI